jgi:hypothetical protein
MSEQTPKYLVRDAQGNVYGPADEAMLRDWVQQGRIAAGMDIAPRETREWIEVSRHPALADLFAHPAPDEPADQVSIGQTSPAAPASSTSPAPAPAPPATPLPPSVPETPVVRQTPAAPPDHVIGTVTVSPRYQPPASYPTPRGAQVNVPAVIGLVTGIVGLLGGLCVCIALPLGIAAIVLGSIGLHQIKQNPQRYRGPGVAIAGLAVGIVAILLGIASAFLILAHG